MTAAAAQHRWKFYRVGGLDQVVLESAADLRHLGELDQKLWVALSCPTKGLELDAKTLALLDLDKDGRVRVPELLAAIRFCDVRLRDLHDLIPGKDPLPLAALNDATPEGKAALGAAKHVLRSLGKADAAALSAADVADTSNVFANTLFNGDGIVPADAAGDDLPARQLIDDALACGGPLTDRSGKPGIDQARLDAFYADLAVYADWVKKGEAEGVRPLGDATAVAFDALRSVRAKVDDYFTRCRLAAFDQRAAAAMNRGEGELAALSVKDLAVPGDEMAALPLSHVDAGRALPLAEGPNPAWAERLLALQRHALGGKPTLSEAEWGDLKLRLAPYETWLLAKGGASVEKLGVGRVLELLGSPAKAAVEALIAQDKALADEAAAIADVVRLVLYARDLFTLLRNFVSFADFYDLRRWAVFQAGTLYLDSRSCELCIKVDDPTAHSILASLSRMYIAYCDLKRPGGETTKVACCFTQGDSDYLMVGRNGVFYDRQGRDWDATITKIIDNPISIRQAFFAPYKKFVRFIEEQVARFAAAKEKESEARLAQTAALTGETVAGHKPIAAAAAVDVGKMVGIIAALGVGAGAIGTLFGGLVSGFVGLHPWWAKVLALLGVVLVISGPSMLIAWLKLRQRTLGPVLDANGWAVNGRVKVNLPLGTALTEVKHLPDGSSRTLDDPFEDREARRRRYALWAAAGLLLLATWILRHYHYWPFRD